MPTITDITDWTGVQAGDEVIFGSGMVRVDEVRIEPEPGDPGFLIAYVSGRNIENDGRPGRPVRMTPNAATLTAVRRDVTNIKDDGEPATAYNATVDDLRRQLVAASVGWEKTNEQYASAVHAAAAAKHRGDQSPDVPASVRDAYAASLMAMGYSYTLAAVLAVAAREYGPAAAKTLAFVADEILTNGDFDEINADVAPTAEVKA